MASRPSAGRAGRWITLRIDSEVVLAPSREPTQLEQIQKISFIFINQARTESFWRRLGYCEASSRIAIDSKYPIMLHPRALSRGNFLQCYICGITDEDSADDRTYTSAQGFVDLYYTTVRYHTPGVDETCSTCCEENHVQPPKACVQTHRYGGCLRHHDRCLAVYI